jgi:hypothetical protein
LRLHQCEHHARKGNRANFYFGSPEWKLSARRNHS